jgi:hypothetical protein
MAVSLDLIQPAPPKDVNVYLPYYKDAQKRSLLPLAISLYQLGNFEGTRTIEGGDNIPFLATWNISTLPADLSRCSVQFAGIAELSYEITMTNFEFIGYLIEVLTSFKRGRMPDFPKQFYRSLLRIDE